LYRHAMNPPPEATYDDVNALKAACKQHAAVHFYSVTTKRSNYKMGVLLLHYGKSGTREGGGRVGKANQQGGRISPLTLMHHCN
jgi:hypothetical protein